MGKPIKSIVVVGGGTAGWIAAAYLNRAFGRLVDVTLIESERVGRIGVGEATVPTLKATLNFLGVDEADWMPRCNATFKSAIKFAGWRKPPPGRREHEYYHPFWWPNDPLAMPLDKSHSIYPQGFLVIQYWIKRWLAGERVAVGTLTSQLQRLCELDKAPKPLPGSGITDPGFRYAYHLDAMLFADYLRDLAVGRGVRHLRLDVVSATFDERGHITKLLTEQGVEVEGELFVDCTGFRGLLINKLLKEPFVSQNNYLLCDSAVALPAEHAPGKRLHPYTTARAMPNGWIWDIPLFHRHGTGYVYNSQICSATEAERTLRGYLGGRCREDTAANHIKMRVGYNQRSWVHNCVAIGLSSCFVEPLESTTIFLIEFELSALLTHFPDTDFDEPGRRQYNSSVLDIFREVRDFIVMHYCLSDRDDSDFWRQVRADALIPESLRATLDHYADGFISSEGGPLGVFGLPSFMFVLSGMEFPFRRYAPIVDLVGEPQIAAALASQARKLDVLGEVMPDHLDYLKSLHQGAASP